MESQKRLLNYLNDPLVSGDRWIFLEQEQRDLLVKLLKDYIKP